MRFIGRARFFANHFQSRYRIARDQGLYQTCGLIRTASRKALRVRRGASLPGHPPHAHTRAGLREINFDVKGHEGIIGPRKFKGSNFFTQPVPRIQERGAVVYSIRRKAFYRYPERSFMYSTTKRLQSRGLIAARFRVTMSRSW